MNKFKLLNLDGVNTILCVEVDNASDIIAYSKGCVLQSGDKQYVTLQAYLYHHKVDPVRIDYKSYGTDLYYKYLSSSEADKLSALVGPFEMWPCNEEMFKVALQIKVETED